MTTISQAQRMVADFQARHCGNGRAELTRRKSADENCVLYEAGEVLARQARRLLELQDRPRSLRASLMAEELSEAVEAMCLADELKLLDALADLLYVVLGTAETFDLPLEEAFEEVHRSNMTKARQADRSARVLDKGQDYRPPDLTTVLVRRKERRETEDLTRNTKAPGVAYD